MLFRELPNSIQQVAARGRTGALGVAVSLAVLLAAGGAVLAGIADPAPRSSAPAVMLPAQAPDCAIAEFECAADPAWFGPDTSGAPVS